MNLGFGKSLETVMWSAIVFVLISALIGFVGMMVMWDIAPTIISIGLNTPLEIIEKTSEMKSFLQLRNTIAITGWFFSLLPFGFWYWQVKKECDVEVKTTLHKNTKVVDK